MSHDWFVFLCGGLVGAGLACLVFVAVQWKINRGLVWSRDPGPGY